jgi:YfiR/HmsC-like
VFGARRSARWTALLAACLIGAPALGATAPPPAVTVQPPPPPPSPADQAAKAAYLAKFAPFVVWPAGAFAGPAAPLVLCVQGDDPFGPALDRLTAGHNVGTHPIIVRRLARIDADSGCQIAYLAGSSAQTPAAALKAVDGRPVLTVTDAVGEGGEKGIVHLVLTNGRVRFMIDAAKANQCGLAISSKLLALASEVKR